MVNTQTSWFDIQRSRPKEVSCVSGCRHHFHRVVCWMAADMETIEGRT